MKSLPPLTCSYLALVSASKLATSSECPAAGSATAVGVCCCSWGSAGSVAADCGRRGRLLGDGDFAMLATSEKRGVSPTRASARCSGLPGLLSNEPHGGGTSNRPTL